MCLPLLFEFSCSCILPIDALALVFNIAVLCSTFTTLLPAIWIVLTMADEDECDVAVAATVVDDAVDEDDENFGFLCGGW